MTSVDERIVKMKFDNAQFESGIKQSTKSLENLKQGLNLDAAKTSLAGLQDVANKFSLQGIAQGVDNISGKFQAMGAIAFSVLNNITTQAMAVGTNLVKSITVDPINQGLKEYETNLNAIQTILSNTQSKGTNLDQVNAALQELNTYSDKTIYNFSEMARNIGTFTAAGVDLNTSVNAIKGIANLAAVSGSSSEQASTAMYQLSQALSTGTVRLMDWNSVVNAGMGGQVFQDAIKETARVHGVAVDQIISEEGSFRDSLQKGWLTSEILTETLAKFTGDLNADQLRTMGYNEEQIAGILKMGQTAQDAATKVKTMSQLINTLQESSGSGWAQTWQIIFGDFEEARTLFTNVNNVIGGMISQSADARNKLLADWKALGGRTAAIDAVKNAFDALMSVVKPIKEAFSEIFPAATAKQLYDITVNIRDFFASLKIGGKDAENLKNTFKGLFAIFDIVIMVVKQIIGVFAGLFSSVGSAGDNILSFTGTIGEFLVKVRDAIKNGDGLTKVFTFIGDALQKPIDLLKEFWQQLSGANGPVITATSLWEGLAEALKKVKEFLQPVADWFVQAFEVVKKVVGDTFASMNFNTLVGILNAGLLGGVILLIKKFIDGFKKLFGNLGGGIIDQIKGVFGALQDTLGSLQKSINAKTIRNIAIAVAILAGAVLVLSFIDVNRLTSSLTAITVMFAQLMAAMAILDKITAGASLGKMAALSGALIALGTAILIMTGAVAIMAKLNWDEIGRGLAGIAGGLAIMIATVKILSTGDIAQIGLLGGSMILLSLGIMVLAGALKIMATMSWDEIGRGLTVLGGGLAALIVGIKLLTTGDMGKMVLLGGAVILLSAGLAVLAGALKIMGSMSWDEIGRGLVVLGGSLLILALGMKLMGDPMTLLGAASLLVVALSLNVIGDALKKFAELSWDEIGRAMVVLAGSLLIIAGAMYLMTGALPGAAALLVVAGALAILAPILKMLGSMSWDQIGTGLGALAATLGILAGAGILLIVALPGLLGLGAAILLIGTGALMAGAGLLAFSAGMVALAAAGTVGAAALKMAIGVIISLIPDAMTALGNGIIQFAATIANGGVQFTAAMTTLLMSLIQAINTVAPAIIETLTNLMLMLLAAMEVLIPQFVESGMKIIVGVLRGIADNIQQVVEAGADIIINFLHGIENKLPEIIDAAAGVVVAFVNGVADAVKNHSEDFNRAGSKLFRGIVDGIAKAIEQGGADIRWAGGRIGNALLQGAMNALGIKSPSREFIKVMGYVFDGIDKGTDRNSSRAANAGSSIGDTLVGAFNKSVDSATSLLSATMDMSPVITPVLDLSQVTAEASKVGSLFGTQSLNVDMAYSTASGILSDQNRSADAAAAAAPVSTGDTITYIQNNNSPKALSNAEVYRQTKNQLSQLKEKLVV